MSKPRTRREIGDEIDVVKAEIDLAEDAIFDAEEKLRELNKELEECDTPGPTDPTDLTIEEIRNLYAVEVQKYEDVTGRPYTGPVPKEIKP